jgi:hypothetical protein
MRIMDSDRGTRVRLPVFRLVGCRLRMHMGGGAHHTVPGNRDRVAQVGTTCVRQHRKPALDIQLQNNAAIRLGVRPEFSRACGDCKLQTYFFIGRWWAEPTLREVGRVPLEQSIDVVRHDIDLPADVFRFARLQAAEAEVGVQADAHSLEQFLVRLECGREQL